MLYVRKGKRSGGGFRPSSGVASNGISARIGSAIAIALLNKLTRYANAIKMQNRLFVHAGAISEVQRGTVTIALRDGKRAEVRPDWIVNCSGVGGASAMLKDPMLAGMFADGLISAAPGNLGLLTTSGLGAVGAADVPSDGLWIVGPPVRGSRFEATAVPELRAMAELVATQIAHGCSRDLSQPSFGAYS